MIARPSLSVHPPMFGTRASRATGNLEVGRVLRNKKNKLRGKIVREQKTKSCFVW